MTLHDYITLGASGLRVSPLCLGAMTFGKEWGWGSTPAESVEVIEAYIASGGNFIDTANIYTKGRSEAILGEYFSVGAGRGKRDRLVIATKCGGNLFAGDPNGGGSSRKGIMRSCEESLRRLRTEYIDLYWIHFWDRSTPIAETMRALDDLVRANKVRYIGLSDHPAWVCMDALHLARSAGWVVPIALQIEYSLLQRTVEGELIPMALANGLGVTPWSPLKSGILSGKYRRDSRPEIGTTRVAADSRALNERTFAIVDALVDIGRSVDAAPAQVALAWLQRRPGVASTIIGARTPAQLEENVTSLAVRLSADQLQHLDALSAPDLPFPCEFLENIRAIIQGGTSINGRRTEPWPLAPREGEMV